MKTLLFTSTLLSGLVAGLFYAYSCSVNMGLKSLSDQEYLKAMQSINRAILNPYFFISFMGLLVVYPVTAYSLFKIEPSASLYLMVSAAAIYFIGVFGVTIFGNVPLNDQLDNFVISEATTDEIAALRKLFENPWNSLHAVRTTASVISFGLTILSVFYQKFK